MVARGIHHLGLAVTDLDEALSTYERLFGAELEHRARVDDQGVEAAAVRVGSSRVELLAPLVPTSVRDFAAYEDHVEGMSADAEGKSNVPEAWYESPRFYFTNPHAIFGPGDTIRPPATERLDYELEIAVVLGGEPGEDLEPAEADAAAETR